MANQNRLIKIVEMSRIKYPVIDHGPICIFDDCNFYGKFEECYLHTHVWCEQFDLWYAQRYKTDDTGKW